MIGASSPHSLKHGSDARLKIRVAVFALLILSAHLTAIPAWARSHTQPGRSAAPSDPDYVSALATANRFLHAWQAGDLENGVVLLSDRIRHSENAGQLEAFFSNASDRAYEIGTGHKRGDRYRFPVVLLAPQAGHVARRSSQIIVANTGKNDWVVDKLP